MRIELDLGEELVITLAHPPERLFPVEISVIYEYGSLIVYEREAGELHREELHRLEGWEHQR